MKSLFASVIGLLAASFASQSWAQQKAYGPGVTDKEVKIGQTMPYSGPASSYAGVGKAMEAYFRKLNASGGVNGRKINLISLDDAYSPPKAVEQTRRLVENDEVFAIVGSFGTASNFATQKYLNAKKVPSLFLGTGANRFSEPDIYPWSMGWQPNNVAKGKIYGKYLLQEQPNARIAVLYQNDDFGRDHLRGLRQGLGEKASTMIVKELSYEISEPTIDSQIQILRATNANVFVDISTPKFAAQAIKKVAELQWKVLHLLSDAAGSIPGVLVPAGLDNSRDVITLLFRKEITDPRWSEDPGMKEYFSFMKEYMPSADATDVLYQFGYGTAQTFEYVLRQCGDDLTRERLMKEASNMKDVELSILLPGLKLNTSPTQYTPISQSLIAQFDGTTWKPISAVLDAEK